MWVLMKHSRIALITKRNSVSANYSLLGEKLPNDAAARSVLLNPVRHSEWFVQKSFR
jgi:hypothetical protein